MRPMPEIIELIRIKKILKSETQVAELLGIHKNSLSRFKTTPDTYPYKELLNFCERECISLDWLLFGKGEQQPAAPVTMEDIDKKIDDLKKRIINIESKLKK